MHSTDFPASGRAGAPLWAAPALRGKRWVDKEIARLNPETDYERIVSLVANYKMNEMVMNLNYCVGFMSNILPKGGTDVVHGTGKAESRPQARYYNTTDPFWTWFIHGPSDAKTQQSVERINRFHAVLYEKYPDSFRENDDWLIAVAMFTIGADRMRAAVGAPPQHRHVQIAFHHFWRDISRQVRTMDGTLRDFPATYEELWAFADDFEQRDYPPAPYGEQIFNSFVAQFHVKNFPRKSERWVRNLVMTFLPAAVIRRHRLAPPDTLAVWVNRAVWRGIFFALDHFAPDNKVPMVESLQSEASQRVRNQLLDAEREQRKSLDLGREVA